MIGRLPILKILPTPLPIGTVQRSSLEASQFAVTIGADALEAQGLMARVDLAHDVLFTGQDPVGLYAVYRRV